MNKDWENNRFLLSRPALEELLGELCTRLGFCSLTDECVRKVERSPLTIDEFTEEILVGERLDPQTRDQLRRQVRSLVAQYYDVATNHGLWWLKFPEYSVEDP